MDRGNYLIHFIIFNLPDFSRDEKHFTSLVNLEVKHLSKIENLMQPH